MNLLRFLAAAALCFAAVPARADTREYGGNALVFSHSLSEDIAISVDPALNHLVRVETDGDASCLQATSAGAVVLDTARCGALSGTLRVFIAPGMPLTISQNGSGDITIGDIAAPLVLSASGNGDIKTGRADSVVLALHGSSDVTLGDIGGNATFDLSGSGDVRVRSIGGPFVVQHKGSGDVAVGRIDADTVTVDSTGSGDILLGSGHVQTLRVRINGDGDFALAGDAYNADVSAHGGGDVKLGKITGTLNRSSGGGSDIYVGGPALVDATIGRIAKAIAEDDNSHGGGVTVIHGSSGSSSAVHGIMMVIVLGVMAFILWRVARRGALRRPSLSMPGQPAAAHAGVSAVTDTLRRVEDRLGRVEGYVTSREFDLQQKFRKL